MQRFRCCHKAFNFSLRISANLLTWPFSIRISRCAIRSWPSIFVGLWIIRLRQVFGVGLEKRDLDLRSAAVPVELLPHRIDTAAVSGHCRSCTRPSQACVRDRAPSEQKRNIFLARQDACGIFSPMSDGPSRLAEGMTAAPRDRRSVDNHTCEHPGCGKDGGFGFARMRQPSH